MQLRPVLTCTFGTVRGIGVRETHSHLTFLVRLTCHWFVTTFLLPLSTSPHAPSPTPQLFQQFNQVTRLPPLPDVLSDTRAAGGGDVDGVLRALQGSLAQAAAGQPPNTPAAAKIKELLAVRPGERGMGHTTGVELSSPWPG